MTWLPKGVRRPERQITRSKNKVENVDMRKREYSQHLAANRKDWIVQKVDNGQ